MFVPISSTNTNSLPAVEFFATITRQAALKNSQSAPAPFFRLKSIRLRSRFAVESLRVLPVMCSRNRRLSETAAASRTFLDVLPE